MTTGIEWTDETWNPITGCTKVSPGCDHCYAERITNRFGGPGAFDTVVVHPDRLDRPLHWRRPRRVFVNSMSDLFHDDVPDDFIGAVFGTMAAASQHQFQILTKRPGRMSSFLLHLPKEIERGLLAGAKAADEVEAVRAWVDRMPWPLPNVWVGTSVENQKWADVRIPKLLETPAAVRFLSCEPLIEPVDLSRYLWMETFLAADGSGRVPTGELDWVIVGGESGPGARPMHPDWARSLRDQCVGAAVPFFFKQWGEWSPDGAGQHLVSAHRSRFPVAFLGPNAEQYDSRSWATLYRRGKRASGRELDGRTWDEYPDLEAVAP